MDSRREPRFSANQPVTVTMHGDSERTVEATVVNFSGRGLRVLLEAPLEPGAAVKIKSDDTLILGDVVYCQPSGGGFAAGLELQHAVYNLGELARLSQALMGECARRSR